MKSVYSSAYPCQFNQMLFFQNLWMKYMLTIIFLTTEERTNAWSSQDRFCLNPFWKSKTRFNVAKHLTRRLFIMEEYSLEIVHNGLTPRVIWFFFCIGLIMAVNVFFKFTIYHKQDKCITAHYYRPWATRNPPPPPSLGIFHGGHFWSLWIWTYWNPAVCI